MFYLNLPAETKIGDTVSVKINGDLARVTWRDKKRWLSSQTIPGRSFTQHWMANCAPSFVAALAIQKESLSVAPTVLSS